ncbi:hypothetical protein BGZ95_011793 [Linnemannia exigua]|uniref:Uncharacterized protein n=1 Tax=Linnemannia exigua TaxID=604196 RepID=A0AAD4D9Z4_9FUNG|nr:hypothetical protein BGZ95_011793 [Linnemannia exigua]
MTDDDGELLEDDDPIRLEQRVPNAPMNIECDMEDFEFTAKLGEVDVGKEFTTYYDQYQPLRYDSDNLADFRVVGSPLSGGPSYIFAKAYFGAKYKLLVDLIDSRVKHPTPDEMADEPFYLGHSLSHILDKPDETRLAHASLTGSVLLREHFELVQLPRHPGIVVRYHDFIDIGVGRVGLSASTKKDQGDLARMLLWNKRTAHEIVTRFEDVEDMNIVSSKSLARLTACMSCVASALPEWQRLAL